jgi:hypothetical protein
MSAASFSMSLGNLNVGDTVYVSLGPKTSHLFDSAVLEFQLTSTPVPEPVSKGIVGAGLVALALRARRRPLSM